MTVPPDNVEQDRSGVFNRDQVRHFDQHSANLRAVFVLYSLIQATKSECSNDLLLLTRTPDGASYLSYFELGHYCFRSKSVSRAGISPQIRV